MATTTQYPVITPGFPVPPGTVYKMVYFFNGPNCGWTETYYWLPGGTFPQVAGMTSIANSFAAARRTGLTPFNAIQAFRYADVTTPGNSTLVVPTNWPLKGTFSAATTDGVNQSPANPVGVQARLSDTLSVVRRNEIWRGIPFWWTNNNANSPSGLSNGSASFQAFMQAMTAVLTFSASTGQGANGTALLRFFIKDPAVTGFQPIQAIGELSGMLTIVTPAALSQTPGGPAVTVGQAVKVSGVRLKCARKLNGIATVLQVIPPTSPATTWTYQLCKQFCCAGQPLVCPRNATLYAVNYGYTKIASLLPQQVGTRKTGRPFRQRVGRRQACCA